MTDSHVNPSGGSQGTSSTLLRRVQAQDPEAWRRFVHLYGCLVYRWCRQAGLQEADASDVGQEVFKAVLGAIGTYHHDRNGDTLRGWLRTITHNKVVDFQRRQPTGGKGVGGSEAQARLQEIKEPDAKESDAALEEDERLLLHRRAVEMILADCKPETSEAFLRVVVQGQKPADVAEDLGISVNAVYMAKSRILRRIREEFAELVGM